MKEKAIHKNIIEYKKIPKKSQSLKKMWEDGWLPAFSEEDGWIVYKEKLIEVKKVLTLHEEWFEKFWEMYPKKTGKKPCENKFFLLKKDDINNVLAWLEEHIKSWDKDIKLGTLKYIPNPLTFLNQERWRDEVILDKEQISHLNAAKMKAQKKIDEDKEEEEKRKNLQQTKMVDDKIKFLEENEPDTIQDMRNGIRESTRKDKPAIAKNIQVFDKHCEIALRIEIRKKYFPKWFWWDK